MNTCDLLENCIRIERTLAEIYETFMKQQAYCSEYACLWEKTALEEHNHEQQFVLAKRMACSMATSAARAPHPSDELLQHVEAVRARVADTMIAPGEAIRLAIGLEEQLSCFHMDQMQLFNDESTNSLFKAMMKHDNEHVGTLKKAFGSLV
jgi:transcription elongation factor GreA-like protein